MSEKTKWEMPKVNLGDTVFHYIGNDARECPAQVTHIGPMTLDLCVLVRNRKEINPVPGVRHKDDPDRKDSDGRGYWARRPCDLQRDEKMQLLLDLLEPKKE